MGGRGPPAFLGASALPEDHRFSSGHLLQYGKKTTAVLHPFQIHADGLDFRVLAEILQEIRGINHYPIAEAHRFVDVQPLNHDHPG